MRSAPHSVLKAELHAELYVALVGLGQHATERRVPRIDRDPAVRRTGRAAAVGVADVGMVREVEDLGPELQAALAAQGHVLEERDVPVREPGAAQDVAAR